MEEAKALKDAGTAFFKKGDFKGACSKYSQAAMKLKPIVSAKDTDADALKGATALQVSCYVNATLCHIKGEQWEEAIDKASRALKLDKKNVKAMFNRGKAYAQSKHRTNALKLAKLDMVAACKLDPKSKAMRQELKKINDKLNPKREEKKKEEVVDKGFLKDGKSSALYEENEAQLRHDKEAERRQLEDFQLRMAAKKVYEDRAKTEGFGEDEAVARVTTAKVLAEPEDKALKDSELGKGYRTREDGTKVPAWARDMSEKDKQLIGDTAPKKIVSLPPPPPGLDSNSTISSSSSEVPAEAAAGTATVDSTSTLKHNAGYEEKEATMWCARKLMSLITPMRAELKGEQKPGEASQAAAPSRGAAEAQAFVDKVGAGGGGQEGAEGGAATDEATDRVAERLPHGEVTTTAPLDLRGEAVVLTVREQRDYIYDFSFIVQWEAKIGEALKKSAVVKGEQKNVFLGYPTFRGSFVFSEVSHDLRKEGKDLECEVRYEQGRRPPDKKNAKFLEAVLGTATVGLKATLLRMVRAFEDEYHKVVSIKQSSDALGSSAPVALAALPTPWQWAQHFEEEKKGEGEGEGDGDGEGEKPGFNLEHKMEELRGQGYMVFTDADKEK